MFKCRILLKSVHWGVDGSFHFPPPSTNRLNHTEPATFAILLLWASLGVLFFCILAHCMLVPFDEGKETKGKCHIINGYNYTLQYNITHTMFLILRLKLCRSFCFNKNPRNISFIQRWRIKLPYTHSEVASFSIQFVFVFFS